VIRIELYPEVNRPIGAYAITLLLLAIGMMRVIAIHSSLRCPIIKVAACVKTIKFSTRSCLSEFQLKVVGQIPEALNGLSADLKPCYQFSR